MGNRLTLALLLAAAPATAADEETIVVTGRSLPEPSGAAAYGTTLVDRARLDSDPAGRLEDALRDVAGFQQFRRTDSRAANPTSQGAALRSLGGNAASRALVLLDGVPVADPFASWIPWPALSPSSLSAARVTRGGGAGAFGAGALSGTIELFSAGPADLPPVSARVQYGSRDSLSADAGVAARFDGGFVTLTGGYDRGDGYVLIGKGQRGPVDQPARYRQRNVAARGVVALGGSTELQARVALYGDDRLRGLAGSNNHNDGKDFSLRAVGRGRWAWEALAYLQKRGFSSGFISTNAARTTLTPTLDQFATPSTGKGAKLELRPPLGAGHDLQIGVDVRAATGHTNERYRLVAGSFANIRRAGGDSEVAGIYVEDGWTLGDRLTLTGGARLDRWTLTDGSLVERVIATGAPVTNLAYPDRSGTETTLRAGALFKATPALSARLAAYQGFRLPTLNELYRPFRLGLDATASDPALDPERLKGIEAGVSFDPLPTAHAGLTLFANRVDDAISNVTLGVGPGTFPQVGTVAAGGAFRRRANIDDIGVKGIEADAALDYGQWRLALSYAFTDAEAHGSGAAAALDGKRPAQSPRQQASATLSWRNLEGARALTTLRYVGAQFEDDLETRRLRGAVTLDASAELPLANGVALTFAAENLTGTGVQSGIDGNGIIDYGTPRTLWVGVRWAPKR